MVYQDRVYGTSTTTGTGALTVAAMPGFLWPSTGEFTYNVHDPVTSAWETGEGHIDYAGRLARDVVFESTNAGGLVNFVGNPVSVVCALTRRNVVFAHYDPVSYPYGNTSASTGGVAGGAGASASGGSVALGISPYAEDHSVSIGFDTSAVTNGVGIGRSASADEAGVAIGGDGVYEPIASRGGIAIGIGAKATSSSGTCGVAIGNMCETSGASAPGFAFGSGAIAGNNGVSLGYAKAVWDDVVTTSVLPDDGATSMKVHDVLFQQTITTPDAGTYWLPNILITNCAAIFEIDVIGLNATYDTVAIRIVGAVRWGGLVGTPVVTVVGRSAAFTAAVTATVGYGGGYMQVRVTGKAATEMRWGINGRLSFVDPRF